MIKKLRRKFVAISMALVAVILAVVFFLLYISMERNIQNLSQQVLQRAIQEDSLLPGTSSFSPSFDIATIGGNRVQLPYFTVNIWRDTAYVTGGTYANLEDTELLADILTECLQQNLKEGTVSNYHLRYLREDNGLFQRIAFVDMSVEQAMLRNTMASYLPVALTALVLLFLVSVLLSIWATRPIAKAWAQQKQFLSDASHELKTPLTVILSNAELLDAISLEERPARWVDNVQSEAIRMKTLVEQMLTLARSDNTIRPAPLRETSLSDIAYDCALSFEPVAFESGKKLDYQIAEDVLIMGDDEKLRQLVSILLDNAIKYGAENGTIALSLQKLDRQGRLVISNSGEPIPPEQLSHLFERFYRADSSRGEKSGFGLGLSIASAIAKEHHGKLRAESDSASTRLLFTFPLNSKRTG